MFDCSVAAVNVARQTGDRYRTLEHVRGQITGQAFKEMCQKK